MAGSLTIRRAETPSEREAVFRFRYDVHVRELGKPLPCGEVVGGEMLRDGLDETARLYLAESGEGPVATLRVNLGRRSGLPEAFAEAYRAGRFEAVTVDALSFTSRLMVARSRRGSAALHLLLGKAYEDALEDGVRVDFCHCAPALVGLYQHLGYRRFTDNFVDPGAGYRVPMVLLLRDAEHLRTVRSPFWRRLRDREALWESDALARWLKESFPVASRSTDWMINEAAFWDFLSSRLMPGGARDVALLDDLTEPEVRAVLKSGAVLSLKPGDPVIRAGEVGREMFVVLSGMVEVRLTGGGRAIAVLEAGEVFGEMAFVASSPRSADVTALRDSEVLVVSQAFLRKLMKAEPTLAAKVLINLSRILCERLVDSNRNLTLPPAPEA